MASGGGCSGSPFRTESRRATSTSCSSQGRSRKKATGSERAEVTYGAHIRTWCVVTDAGGHRREHRDRSPRDASARGVTPVIDGRGRLPGLPAVAVVGYSRACSWMRAACVRLGLPTALAMGCSARRTIGWPMASVRCRGRWLARSCSPDRRDKDVSPWAYISHRHHSPQSSARSLRSFPSTTTISSSSLNSHTMAQPVYVPTPTLS